MKHVLPTARLTTLGDRLQRVNRITLGFALLIVALLIIASSFSISLFSLVDASRVKASVLAENASASLMFQDARSAQELLQSLQQSPDVHAAALYDKNRQQFASFVVPEHSVPASIGSLQENMAYGWEYLNFTQPVMLDGELIGGLYLNVDLAMLYMQMAWQATITLGAAFLAMLVANTLLRRLNRSVLQPINGLSALMEQVSDQNDYSARAGPSDITELNALAEGFNDMLEQIQQRDIARKEAENKTLRLAYFDSLTGLPNRQSFLERLGREVRIAEREKTRLAILFMDLDGFKGINDSMGHNTGDLILQWAADRLQQGIRPYDMVVRAPIDESEVELARLGGDEFTALIPRIAKPEDALLVAHRIRELMRRPFVLEGREVVLTASIGIAVYPDDGEDASSLLKHADTAMYHAKDEGRDNCQFYSASLTERVQHRLNLESNLRHALARNEFSLVYQPQFDLIRGSIQSVEALIRWNHPEQGVIPPLDFIPLAEENGLIVPIGEWVLRTACADAARWRHEGHALRVAVNLSPMQFKDPELVKMVLGILGQTGLPPELLELEITEGAVMEDSGATLATLEALSLQRVQIALDDFGTGYSSMSYLKRMPLNNLKVDQSFVKGLPHDRDNRAIVRAILSMARNLGFSVTAEGVETLEQADALKKMACDTLQGYYFSRPVPAADIPALLSRQWLADGPSTCFIDPASAAASDQGA
ncbi:MAG: EAL domain-containing protein [Thiobacillus sp.]|jgi:diguanylate cyclase (GGDEF)-like protein|nr:EAL domain-containing protein [Thiobacillus sp.]